LSGKGRIEMAYQKLEFLQTTDPDALEIILDGKSIGDVQKHPDHLRLVLRPHPVFLEISMENLHAIVCKLRNQEVDHRGWL